MNMLPVNDLTNIEHNFWNYTNYAQRITQTITDTVVGQLRNPNITPTQRPPQIDLTSFSYEEIIQHLIDVQRTKLRFRMIPKADGSFYQTFYNPQLGVDPDVCAETIIYHGRTFTLELRYDGGNNTRQPGNCLLIETGRPALHYGQLPDGDFNNPAVRLLFFTEIVRRKAIDPHRGYLQDEYHTLPVGLGIYMAYQLFTDGRIAFGDFWFSWNTYHIFSGDGPQRWNRFQALFTRYHQEYMNGMQNLDEMRVHLERNMLQFYSGEPECYLVNLFG
ncbi:unnamed protein product [Adineta steineri]|uniref:Uncharacterized protein n=1 Tax=Adineta steineri TaxID=433720 RepID=A0A819MK56_9BILA|nr:unnamed protein product [Adineta steineri]CAF3981564.1 unnamed protein product [Adineta steineri]